MGEEVIIYAQQQINHLMPSVVETTLDYYPPPCELSAIVTATIAACDPLDGKTDGVVSRTDLCMLHFNLSSTIGTAYNCSASSSSGEGPLRKRATQPAQVGTVSANGVAVAQAIYDGLHNSYGQRAYLSWQIGSELSDAETTYDSTTDSWALDINSFGGEFVERFVLLRNASNISSLDGVTYDTLIEWMKTAYVRYLASLQTTYPDLTDFESHGGKLLHYHGESDASVPAASSVHYWQSVRGIMYPHKTHNASLEALAKWYQLYLVPGAGHCGANSLQPDGPYLQDNMATMIDWVENGVQPTFLNGTIGGGTDEGKIQRLCRWPKRPLWTGNTTQSECVVDEKSLDTWTYKFPAFKVPIY